MSGLDEEKLEQLRLACGGKIGVIDWSGHQIVFRRPSRDQVRDYRVKQESVAAKVDAVDQLAQQTIVAFDGVTDLATVRMTFLAFLDAYPAFTSAYKVNAVMTALSGMVEEEVDAELGKGASVRSAPPKTSPAV